MNVNDASAWRRALAFVDYLPFPRPDPKLTRQIGIGLNRAAREAELTLAGAKPRSSRAAEGNSTSRDLRRTVAISKIVTAKARPGDASSASARRASIRTDSR